MEIYNPRNRGNREYNGEAVEDIHLPPKRDAKDGKGYGFLSRLFFWKSKTIVDVNKYSDNDNGLNVAPPVIPYDLSVVYQSQKSFRMSDAEIEHLYRSNMWESNESHVDQLHFYQGLVRELQHGLCSLHLDKKKFFQVCLQIEQKLNSEIDRIYNALKDIIRIHAAKINTMKRTLEMPPNMMPYNTQLRYSRTEFFKNKRRLSRTNIALDKTGENPLKTKRGMLKNALQTDEQNGENEEFKSNEDSLPLPFTTESLTNFDVVRTELALLKRNSSAKNLGPVHALEKAFENLCAENAELNAELTRARNNRRKFSITNVDSQEIESPRAAGRTSFVPTLLQASVKTTNDNNNMKPASVTVGSSESSQLTEGSQRQEYLDNLARLERFQQSSEKREAALREERQAAEERLIRSMEEKASIRKELSNLRIQNSR